MDVRKKRASHIEYGFDAVENHVCENDIKAELPHAFTNAY